MASKSTVGSDNKHRMLSKDECNKTRKETGARVPSTDPKKKVSIRRIKGRRGNLAMMMDSSTMVARSIRCLRCLSSCLATRKVEVNPIVLHSNQTAGNHQNRRIDSQTRGIIPRDPFLATRLVMQIKWISTMEWTTWTTDRIGEAWRMPNPL